LDEARERLLAGERDEDALLLDLGVAAEQLLDRGGGLGGRDQPLVVELVLEVDDGEDLDLLLALPHPDGLEGALPDVYAPDASGGHGQSPPRRVPPERAQDDASRGRCSELRPPGGSCPESEAVV